MDRPLAALGKRFAFNNRLLDLLAAGMEPADWSFAPLGGGNSAHWILGHACHYRRWLRRKSGDAVPAEPWEAQFPGGKVVPDPAKFPPAAELAQDFLGSGARLEELLGAAGPEAAAADVGTAFADGTRSLEGAAHFLYFHETYHLGQVGILRRMRGKPAFA